MYCLQQQYCWVTALLSCAYAAAEYGQCNQDCVCAAAANANAIKAELSYDWAPAADMALTVAPTSLFKATTCRFSCGPLCTATEKLIAQPV